MKVFSFIFILLMCCKVESSDIPFYPKEKYHRVAHVAVSGGMTGISYYALKYLSDSKKDSYIASILLSLGVGLWKEIWDVSINKHFNHEDMGYNGIGVFSVSIGIYFEEFIYGRQ